jgi:hypothetical protein
MDLNDKLDIGLMAMRVGTKRCDAAQNSLFGYHLGVGEKSDTAALEAAFDVATQGLSDPVSTKRRAYDAIAALETPEEQLTAVPSSELEPSTAPILEVDNNEPVAKIKPESEQSVAKAAPSKRPPKTHPKLIHAIFAAPITLLLALLAWKIVLQRGGFNELYKLGNGWGYPVIAIVAIICSAVFGLYVGLAIADKVSPYNEENPHQPSKSFDGTLNTDLAK